MRKRTKFLVLAVILAVLAVGLTPTVTALAARCWIRWAAARNGFDVDIGQIDAPLLRPVVIHSLRLTSTEKCGFAITLSSGRIVAGLNLRALLPKSDVRAIRSIAIDNFRGAIRERPEEANASCDSDWSILQRVLPDALQLSNAALEIESGSTVVRLRGIGITASETEIGRFTARDVTVNAPLLRQTFSNLRGATSWQDGRITLAALSLARGLDLQSVTADLNHLGKRRLGVELNLDTFGGKLRASVSGERDRARVTWDATASASKVSLAQLSDAFGFTEQAGGSVRDFKLSFRGDLAHAADATASIWAEVTDFSWRGSQAETVTLGMSSSARQVHIEQVYLKQRDNQLTFSGDAVISTHPSQWLRPDFNGYVSGSIGDLGDFAQLFGAKAAEFGGTLTIDGAVDRRDLNLTGHLTFRGSDLRVFGAPATSFDASLLLNGSQLELERLELRHGSDSVTATGAIDLAGDHPYMVRLSASVAELSQFSIAFPPLFSSAESVRLDWDGTGSTGQHHGEFNIAATGVHAGSSAGGAPLTVNASATYSPQSLFFENLEIASSRTRLTAFVNVGPDFLHVQQLEIEIDDQVRSSGDVYLPIRVAALQAPPGESAIDAAGMVALDLTLFDFDLSAIREVLPDQRALSGTVTGSALAYGDLASLNAQLDLAARGLQSDGHAPSNLHAHLTCLDNIATVTFEAAADKSDATILEATIPLELSPDNVAAGKWSGNNKPVSGFVDFRRFAVESLPQYLRPGLLQGTISGRVDLAGTLQAPTAHGAVQLTGVTPAAGEPNRVSEIAGDIRFAGSTASAETLQMKLEDMPLVLSAHAEFAQPRSGSVTVTLRDAAAEIPAPGEQDCISGVDFVEAAPTEEQNSLPTTDTITLSRDMAAGRWTCTLGPPKSDAGGAAKPRTLPICGTSQLEGDRLSLRFRPPLAAASGNEP